MPSKENIFYIATSYFEVKNPVSAKPTKTLEESIPCLLRLGVCCSRTENIYLGYAV